MAMEDSWATSIKIINAPPFHLAILFLGISPTNMLTLEQKHTCVRVLLQHCLERESGHSLNVHFSVPG